MSFILLLSLCTLVQLSFGQGLSPCFECKIEPSGLCCLTDISCGDPRCDTGVPFPTGDPDPATTISDPTVTDDPTVTTEEPGPDPGVCKYWSSGRAATGNTQTTIVGGLPLDVCLGAFSGVELTSTSYIYTCSADKSTVEYWHFTGSSDCNAEGTATEARLVPWSFDPLLDPFECRGEPCPHFIVMDATSHPTQTCPYDTGKLYTAGEDDYATWHEKAILQGCQSFDGQTSFALKCSDDGGISRLDFGNTNCGNAPLREAEMLPTATVECNYGTGRSVSCENGITSRNPHFAYNDPDPNYGMTTTEDNSVGVTGTGTTMMVTSDGNLYGIYQAIFGVLGMFLYLLW